MNLKSRVRRLELVADRMPEPSVQLPRTDQEWYEQLKQWGEEGAFVHESDFPLAMAEFKAAIDRAGNCDKELRWLLDMVVRVQEGKPAVTIAEFHELAAWFTENEARLPHLLLEVPTNYGIRKVYIREVSGHMKSGPRDSSADWVVEMLRLAKAKYGIG